MADPRNLFLQQYFHVALPRDVPGAEEENLSRINSALLERLIVAVRSVALGASPGHRPRIEKIRLALETCKIVNFDGALGKGIVEDELRRLTGERLLILHIAKQNAALLVYRQDPASHTSNVIFEAFETSATCEAVLATQNALKWDFPGCAVSVRHEEFSKTSFQELLAASLEQASIEYVQKFAPVTYKAAAPLREIRDTSDPALITGMLMALLEGIGSVHAVKLLPKRVRDTVCFQDAYKPWRRSAFYLVVRVAIQRHLYRMLGHEVGGTYYKTIMCVLVANLLNDAHAHIPHEAAHILRQKLGQRLAKLEATGSRGSTTMKSTHDHLLGGLRPTFDETLAHVGRFLANKWKGYRLRCERNIPQIPQNVPMEQFRLALHNSTPHLNETTSHMSSRYHHHLWSASELLAQYEKSVAAAKPYIHAAKLHISLLRFEEDKLLPCKRYVSLADSKDRCKKLSEMIHEYISEVGDSLDGYPEFKSRMLLHIMELWVEMDRDALRRYPLLVDYHPAFGGDILDTLELLGFNELERAHAIRLYITDRCLRASPSRPKTIFASPSSDSFAVRYFDQCQTMMHLRQEIESRAEQKRIAKEQEWQAASEQYGKLRNQQATVSCIWDPVVTWDDRIEEKHRWPCKWHSLNDEMAAMQIKLFEHPLPAFEPSAKAAVFELVCPEDFVAYRDATWVILATLAYSKTIPLDRVSLLCDYSELRMYANNVEKHLSLASAPKSHLRCHYAMANFPVDLEEICRTCGLKLDYFDDRTRAWAYRQEKVSFLRHFFLKLPPDSPFRDFQHSYDNWPSSNEILAGQGSCPTELNVHEFMAWQDLLVGTSTRWPSLLRELGSTNMNFSTDSTWALVTRLVLQTGPCTSNGNAWGDIHAVFLDHTFCQALLEQIRLRSEAIRRNWREFVQMDILITLLLKTSSCASLQDMRREAIKLLRTTRIITAQWCADLQALRNVDTNMSTEPLVWASLLCKRTFHLGSDELDEELSESLKYFIHASVVLQDNLRKDFAPLPFNLRTAILRDVLFAYAHRFSIHREISTDAEAFKNTMGGIWTLPEDCNACTLQSVSGADPWWILLTLTSVQQGRTHYVHYNYVYGTLLVDGQELRTLPLEYRSHTTYRELFGTRTFRAFPSPLPGMSYAILDPMPNGDYVHMGMGSENRLLVRAIHHGSVLEFLPRGIFGDEIVCDLPFSLVEKCYHWLNHHTGQIEVRQDIWKSKPTNWFIHRQHAGTFARRHTSSRDATLLEPMSLIARQIAQIFSHFEDSSHIMVYQEIDHRTKCKKIFVDLKRMELSFYVNTYGLLQSDRLGASITANQDIGTWHGLKSKILIRSTSNLDQWSILIPLGKVQCRRDRVHVAVEIETGTGLYLKFDINHLLGRIECPPEPRLLYTKALLHACTSHFLPDRLTRRTGQEEALALLKDGSHQPWSPLGPDILKILHCIAELSPRHKYYPEDLRCMETVTWRSDLIPYMQNERYRVCVEKICLKSAHLAKFALGTASGTTPSCPPGNEHLELRALSRIYGKASNSDLIYIPRDQQKGTLEYANVLNTATTIRHWESYPSNIPDLISLLRDSHIIGGYGRQLDRFQFSDLLAIDLKAKWGSLAQNALESDAQDKYRLMFLYGPMAFSSDVNMDLLKVLISLSRTPKAKAIPPPQWPAYFHFRADKEVPLSYLVSLMENAKKSFDEALYIDNKNIRRRHQKLVAENKHYMAQETACLNLAKSIQAQWPCQELNRDKLVHINESLLDLNRALEDIDPEWTRLTRNHELSEYLEKVQAVLNQHAVANTGSKTPAAVHTIIPQPQLLPAKRYPRQSACADLPNLRDLLMDDKLSILSNTGYSHGPSNPLRSRSGNIIQSSANRFDNLANNARYRKQLGPPKDMDHRAIPPHVRELSGIVQHVQQAISSVHKRYGLELEKSIKAHVMHISRPKEEVTLFNRGQLSSDIARTRRDLLGTILHFREVLATNDRRAHWLEHAQLWPRITVVEILKELSTTNEVPIHPAAKDALVKLGIKITKYQRLLRIEDAFKKCKQQQLADERANIGHTNWDPADHVDWLLLEIDGDIMLREEQVEVALATIAPESGENALLQLLMGKGKTSCILPMVASELANKENLARIVVPKPLLLQSAQVLQAKLGGLVNREIMHIPFSRRTPTDCDLMQLYKSLHLEVQGRRSIMICLPEHILSFQLSGMQQLCDKRVEEASIMIKTQNWLNKVARDVLDECDVSLAIRTQLIYPSGSQMTVDGHPLRWQTVQGLLRLVVSLIPAVYHRFPRSVEMVRRAVGGYPLIYFLRQEAEKYLIHILVEAICEGSESILPCPELSTEDRDNIKAFVSNPMISLKVDRRVQEMFGDKSHLLKTVHLLRGLFVHRILISTLKKRWNVQYGLHPLRDPMAVPYSAKGVPSPTAEWGHPDVAIILTCLSFYYQGLNTAQFKQAFEQLVKSDDPSVEYEKWTSTGVPLGFSDYTAINAEDDWQLNELHAHIRYNVYLLDFYLNNFVFPRYAKQFRTKLQASGWDLVLFNPEEKSRCRTTGFSGTNDSRHQLPITITQADLPQLAHTNAEVLSYLLQPRNREYVLTVDTSGKRLTEVGLLEELYKYRLKWNNSIKILIDAGAQILEHDNRSLAKAWLDIDQEAAACVYFSADHRAWVLYRTAKCIPLLASPFAENMEKCLVYLDESHCRGTDLKLPPYARAALTLGQHLTKDALVQAAMRLRLLGQSQSVTFYSPPEVHQSILDLRNKPEGSLVDSSDVIAWLLQQSCNAIEQLEPLYFTQGTNYLQHVQARIDNPDFLENETSRAKLLSVVRAKELQTLKQLYEPKHTRRLNNEKMPSSESPLKEFALELNHRKKTFQDRGTAIHASALEEVEIEVEREVEYEVESVREIQRPILLRALKYGGLHKDIEHFAMYGRLLPGSDAYQPMFSALQKTGLGRKHGGFAAPKSNLFVSTEFSRTVNVVEPHDHYMRPCQWVVWSFVTEKALIVSHEEADDLIPILRSSSQPGVQIRHTHLIVYSPPVTRRTLHFNSLNFFAIPPLPKDFQAPGWLKIELGIFSGKLYFEWDEYNELLGYLGETLGIPPHGGVTPAVRQAFAKKPLTFLHEWLALRRKGQDFEHTPMGYITTGKRLTEEHSFFSKRSAEEEDPDLRPGIAYAPRPEYSEEDDEEVDHDDEEEHVAPIPEDFHHESGDHFLDSESEGEFEDALEHVNKGDEDIESD